MPSCSVVSGSCDPMDCSPPGSSIYGIGFSRQEHCSGMPSPSPEDLPDPGIKSVGSRTAGGFFTTEPMQIPSRQSPNCTPLPRWLWGLRSPWPHSPNKCSSQAQLPALLCGSSRSHDTLEHRSPKTLLFNLDQLSIRKTIKKLSAFLFSLHS